MSMVAAASAARCVFCAQCGTLVDEPTRVGADVACRLCGTVVGASVKAADCAQGPKSLKKQQVGLRRRLQR